MKSSKRAWSVAALCLGMGLLSSGVALSEAQTPARDAARAERFDPDAATSAYLARLSPEARAKSDAYFEGGYWLTLWDFVSGIVVAWLFLGTPLSSRLRDRAERMTKSRWLQAAIYSAVYIVISTLVLLPWSAYEGYYREHQYNMSNQTLWAWLVDQMKGLGINVVLGTLLLTLLYGVLRKTPKTWWIWGSVATMAMAMFVTVLAPVYLEPVFNDFKPLANGTLKDEILSMARANGIPASEVYQFDASRQTKRMSAHVSGLFGTTRISLNDNLLNRGSMDEIRSIVGHEMGHYVLNHVSKSLVFGLVGVVCGFAFMKWSFDKVREWGLGGGVREVSDVAGLPLLLFLFSVYSFVTSPVQNTLIRTMEAEADNYGLNASRKPDGFAEGALHLSEYRKMQPGPIEEWVFYDHPSGFKRIHRAMVWKAEHFTDPDIAADELARTSAAETRPQK